MPPSGGRIRLRTAELLELCVMAGRGTSRAQWGAMIDGLFAGANYQGLKKMLDATVMRQEAIASNLANLETPHYKRLDVEGNFSSELSRAISGNSDKAVNSLQPRVGVDRSAVAQNRDGNSVQLEKELLHLQKNLVAHQLQTQMITGRLAKLRMAITTRS